MLDGARSTTGPPGVRKPTNRTQVDQWHHRPSRWAYVSWRYAVRKHRKEQRRLANVLADHWDTRARKPGKRMQCCCDNFLAVVNIKSGKAKPAPMHCDVMVCPVCLHHRHRTTLEKAFFCVGESMEDGDILRHIVLTTPRWKGDPRHAAERLAHWYGKLVRRKAWKTHVRASMAVFETTWNVHEGWMWHVHVLSVGSYWQNQCKVETKTDSGQAILRPADPATECECKQLLSCCGDTREDCTCAKRGRRNRAAMRCLMQEWHQVTDGHARIVHISAAGTDHRSNDGEKKTARQAIVEAVKYVVKSIDLDRGAIVDFVIGMRSFQRVRWGGEWYGMQPPDAEAAEPRIVVCPTDLWRLSRGDITELFARVSGDPFVLAELPAVDGVVMLPAYGATNEEHARPPPWVKLSQAFAVAAVESLETASSETEHKTDRYLQANPTKALDLQGMHLPF